MKTLLPILLFALAAGPASAVTAPDQLRLADGLFARGMYELALREYTSSVDQPGVTNLEVVLYRMAESQRELGRKDEAGLSYARVVTGFPQSVYAQRSALRLAERAVAEARFAEAAALLKAPAEGDLEPALRPAWRYHRALAERQAGRPSAAEPVYRRLIKEDADSPYAPFARLELAELVQARDPTAPEIMALLEAVADGPGPSKLAGQAAERLAAHLYERKEFAASAAAYADLLKQDPARRSALWQHAAWAHFQAGQWTETLAALEGHDEPEALYMRANSLRQLDQVDKARASYAQLIKDHPGHALAETARYESAVLALRAKDFTAARQLASQVTPTPAWAADLLWVQAESARGAGQAEEAVAFYDQLVREQPKSDKVPAARFQAARLQQEAGQWEDASTRYRALAGAPAGHDLAAEALFASAYARVQLKQLPEAIQDWTRLIKDYPKFRALDEALYGRAQAESELGQAAAGRSSLDRLLKDYPKSKFAPEAHYLLGTLLEQDDKWEGAEFHYRVAARSNPDGALARRIEFRRVAVLQRQGRNDEAAAALNTLLAQPAAGQGVPPALLDWLARWNLQQKLWPEAERAAVALSGQGGAWVALGWYQAGRAREELGQLDPARVAYRQAMGEGTTREAVDAAYRLGLLADRAGDGAEARRALTKAAERAASEELSDLRARSYLALGELAEREGQLEEAARTFLSVALLYEDNELTPQALYRTAGVLQKLGRTAEREQTLRELHDRYPESTWAKREPLAP